MAERIHFNREPHIRHIGPDWWHHHGMKMSFQEKESTPSRVIIRGSAAELVISKDCLETPGLERGQVRWNVNWGVKQSLYEFTVGRVLMGIDTLQAAFGFEHATDRFSTWLIDKYGGDAAEQGMFIRWRNYLNIPGPGTGHDGDPNISLQLDGEIKNAVAGLILAELSPEEGRMFITRQIAKADLSESLVRRYTATPLTTPRTEG